MYTICIDIYIYVENNHQRDRCIIKPTIFCSWWVYNGCLMVYNQWLYQNCFLMFACFLCLQVVSSYSSVSPTHCGMLQYIFLDSACLEPRKGLFPEAYHFPGPVLFWFQSMPFASMLTHHQLLHRSNATYIHDPLLVAEIVEVLFAYDSAVDLPN